MKEISIVRRRSSRVLPIVLVIVLLALLALAALWFFGDAAAL